MITARAELLKDVKNHGMARLRACESHDLAASALVIFFFFVFFCAWHQVFVPVRHARGDYNGWTLDKSPNKTAPWPPKLLLART